MNTRLCLQNYEPATHNSLAEYEYSTYFYLEYRL